MDVIEAIRSRRSIRHFKPDPVSDEEINAIIEAARWAPSGGNRQPWEFIIVRDATKRAMIAELYENRYKKTADNLLREEYRRGIDNPEEERQRILKKINRGDFRAVFLEAPVSIVVCGNPNIFPHTYMLDVSCAIENMFLAAQALGLGSTYIEVILLKEEWDAEKIRCLFGIPENIEAMAILPLGYPAGSPNPPPRKTVKEMTYYGRYGKKR